MISEATIKNCRDHIIRQLTYICKNEEMAKDAFQDACITCFNSKTEYMHGGLYIAAKWRMIDLQRQQNRIEKFVYKDHVLLSKLGFEFDTLTNIEYRNIVDIEYLENYEFEEKVLRMINDLEEVNQKEVLTLRVSGVGFKEIAKRRKISINTALGQSRYGINNIRKKLNIRI